MVARGHGIEALCAYLGLARALLLDLVVELDLPTPHDRPPRKPGGRNPWSLADTALFIALWVAGWHAESLAERFGRTAGAVRAKARRLGLPRRDRGLVFRPAQPGRDLPGGVLQGFRPDPGVATGERACPGDGAAAPAGDADPDEAAPAPVLARTAPAAGEGAGVLFPFPLPLSFPVFPPPAPPDADPPGPAPVGTPATGKPKRRQTAWTRERDRELARRWWARQHYKAIARDMGVSPAAVQSRAARLELPTFNDLKDMHLFRREELVDHFDPTVVEAHIEAAGYHERACNRFASEGKDFRFWAPRRNGNRTSAEAKRLERKRDARLKLPSLPPPVRSAAAAVHAW